MSAAHTPGPWHVSPTVEQWSAVCDEFGESAYEAVIAGDDCVALVVSRSPDEWSKAPPTKPNANLIGAAPDLLRALQLLLDRSGMEWWPVEQEVARAAIAKAIEGEA